MQVLCRWWCTHHAGIGTGIVQVMAQVLRSRMHILCKYSFFLCRYCCKYFAGIDAGTVQVLVQVLCRY